MKFLKNIWKKKIRIGSFFGSTPHELDKFLGGIGESEILESSVKIKKYPFEPSSVYPEKEIHAIEIDEVHLDEYPPTMMIKAELIFIKRESIELLLEFAKRNGIKIAKRASNWNLLTAPTGVISTSTRVIRCRGARSRRGKP